jgi:hypothetical protein
MKKLNQELYDQLFGAIVYIIEYSKKYNISIPNGEALKRMTDKIHSLMNMKSHHPTKVYSNVNGMNPTET